MRMLPEGLGHRGCGRSAEGHPPMGVTTGRGCGDQDSVRGRRAADGAATRSGAPRGGGSRSRWPDSGGLGLLNGARSDTAPSLRHETVPNHRLQGAVALNESKMPASRMGTRRPQPQTKNVVEPCAVRKDRGVSPPALHRKRSSASVREDNTRGYCHYLGERKAFLNMT